MQAQRIGSGVRTARISAPFAAAMQALQVRRADSSPLLRLRDEEWRELLPLLDRVRLTLPLAHRGYLGLPGWVQERLERNVADTAQHWTGVKAAYREAAGALDAAGLEHVVIKGFTQAPEYVARPQLRMQADIDFYMPQEQIPEAVRRLEEMGYSPCQSKEEARYADHVPPLARFGDWKWNGNMFDPDVPPLIELHFCLWNDAVYSIAVPEIAEFWGRRRLRKVEELLFPALYPVDHAGYFALHLLRGILNGELPVHHARELAVFLHGRAGDGLFWGEWAMLHSPRLRRMQAIAFWLANAWFSCNLPAVAKAEIASLPPRVRAWLENCGCASFECLFRRVREGRLLQLLLAETPEARRQIVWTAVAPTRVASPAKVATFGQHTTNAPKPNRVMSYLRYPAYIFDRIRMNGAAVLRFVARACVLYLPSGRGRERWHEDLRSAQGD